MERFRRALNDFLGRGESPAGERDDELAVIRALVASNAVGRIVSSNSASHHESSAPSIAPWMSLRSRARANLSSDAPFAALSMAL